ncbi:P-loop containing nucleoside triphosphate hydrolase [Pseudocohnilembus persalinus]|uniref:p-loop containing nucleoside triphosphate hydrolase n=1 Tax=Pseudocohnilembus persalinus TaxID=266149 RepID=A0A0V0QC07_PSEPJ|nr:P-loop containing nucleoside triphosphate hydrolase [Pseudocohnilembus persalinus]|eukprot:KRW99728.1 P-loop containing nucleoside triphosphate hydrolase [Pseudocohnilembus persalinus]
MSQKKEYVAKVLIIGEAKVGKTSILTTYTEGVFPESTMPTLGIDYRIKRLDIGDQIIKLQIWDTAGQERFRSITQNFYKGAMGIILTFDLNDKSTFDNLQNWLQRIKEYSGESVCIIILANKCELEPQVSDEQIKDLEQKQSVKCFKTSAKENIGITQAFSKMAHMIQERNFSQQQNSENNLTGTNKLQANGQNINNRKSGCRC